MFCGDRRARYLREPFHVALDDGGVRTLELLDDVEAVAQLGEDVGDGAGEERVLRRLLEL